MPSAVKNPRSKKEWVVTSLTNDLQDFDAYEVLLGGMTFRNVTIKAIRGAATEVKKETLSVLRGVFPGAWKSNSDYKDSVYQAVRVGRTKIGLNNTETSAHVLGVRQKDSQTYKLRFYEGLVTRRTRYKGTPRVSGRDYKTTTEIGGLKFFEQARSKVDVWGTIRARLDKYLKEHNWQTV